MPVLPPGYGPNAEVLYLNVDLRLALNIMFVIQTSVRGKTEKN